MIFTTTMKKAIKPEKYPELPVMTQIGVAGGSRENSVFELNNTAMARFGFESNKANVNKVTIGYDEDNNIVIAALDNKDAYTSNVTAKNTFSSKKLLGRLVKQFDIEASETHEFLLFFDPAVAPGQPMIAILAILIDTPLNEVEVALEVPEQAYLNSLEASKDEEAVIIADLTEAHAPVEAIIEEVEAEVVEAIEEASMEEIPAPSPVFEQRESAFASSPHVVKVGAVLDGAKEDW
jgi:hypothetical protein